MNKILIIDEGAVLLSPEEADCEIPDSSIRNIINIKGKIKIEDKVSDFVIKGKVKDSKRAYIAFTTKEALEEFYDDVNRLISKYFGVIDDDR